MCRKISNFQAIMLIIALLLSIRIYGIEVNDDYSPSNGSTGNSTSTLVIFKVVSDTDTIDVAPETVAININGDIFNHESDEVTYSSLGQYAGDSYRFIFDPEDDFFFFGDSVNVEITAEGTQGETMEPFSWNFFIVEDYIPPLIWNFDPDPDGVDMEVDDDITFEVYDEGSGVNRDSVSIRSVLIRE